MNFKKSPLYIYGIQLCMRIKNVVDLKIWLMCLKNRAMSVRNINISLNIQERVIVARDTVGTIKYGLWSHRAARKSFITLKQRKRIIEWAKHILIISFSSTNLCFKLLIILLDGLTMRELVLRRVFGRYPISSLRHSETDKTMFLAIGQRQSSHFWLYKYSSIPRKFSWC